METKQDIITGREVAAEAYRQMLAESVERSPNLIGLANGDGRLQYVNQTLRNALQFSQEELIGKPFTVIFSKNNSSELLQEIVAKTFEPGGWKGECLIPRKDGTDAPVLLSSSCVRDERGKVLGAISIAQDITERKRAEELLRSREYFLSESQRLGHVGTWFYDPTGPIAWSPEMYRLYGVSPDTFTPTIETFLSLIHPADRPAMQAWIAACAAGDKPGECDFRIKKADGTIRFMAGRGEALHDAKNRLIHMAGSVQDITERKHLEELRLKREFDLLEAQRIAGIGSFLWTLASGTLEWSTGLKLILRRDPDLPPPTFDGLSRFYTPESFERVMAAARKVIETGTQHEIEVEMLCDDGTTCWTTLRGEALRGPDGLVAAIQGIVQDIDKRKRAEEAQHKSAEEFRAAFEDAPFGMCLSSLDNQFLRVNQAFCQLLGYSKEELLAGGWLRLTHSDDLERSRGAVDELRSGRVASVEFEKRYIHRQGNVIWVRMRISVVRDGRGEPSYFITHIQDITERVKAEERMQLWSRVLDQSAEGIMICDPQERILLVNKAFERLTGFSAEEVLGKTPRILESGRQDRAFYADLWKSVLETGSWQGEMWNRRKNGEVYVEWLSISAVYDHKRALTHYVGIFSDITVRKRDEDRMVHLAHYDALTDLPNRVLLMDRLNQLTKAAQRRKSKVAVVFIDLDRFKEVNDSLGHDAGDVLLQTIAKRFSSVVRGEDTMARIGGDEFVAVFQNIHDGQDASIIARGLFSCLKNPVTLNGYELTVTASMGISIYPDDASDGQEMIRNADAAMYQAKGAGRNVYQFYTSDLNQRALEMLSMESDLRRAIERQEFVLYYQPQVDVISGSLVGAEALIRWRHPEFGLVMPGKFICIAEERGLIIPIGSWVIDEAARQAAVWQNAGTPIRIAVNVSAVQFRQKDFVEQVENSVRKHGIIPDNLELELTESIVMRDAETTVKILERLHNLGFQLSIDDFGTGYSSLSYLRRFPIDKIKIDQSFVRDENAGSIVLAVISLAQSLKVKVIAEGVETSEQLEILREQHCDEAQGFLFSPALVSAEFEKLVRNWKPEYLRSRESLIEPSK